MSGTNGTEDGSSALTGPYNFLLYEQEHSDQKHEKGMFDTE